MSETNTSESNTNFPLDNKGDNKKNNKDRSVTKHSNASLSKTSTQFTDLEKAVHDLEIATKLAKSIKTTKFAENFKTVDDDNNEVIREEDIVAAILFGAELGISPMKTLALGSELNKNSYFAIQRGRNLGLDEITSLKNIHAFSTGGKTHIYTGVHIISKVLMDAGVDIIWENDFAPYYWYYDAKTQEEIPEDKAKSDIYHIIVPSDTKEIITKAKEDGKRFLKRKADRVTSAIFKRDGRSDLRIDYYLSDAIEARLYKGVATDGETVDGKDNWNKYPKRMMRNRVIITGGREIASDRLFDTYLKDEISSISSLNDNDVEDAEYEQIN